MELRARAGPRKVCCGLDIVQVGGKKGEKILQYDKTLPILVWIGF